MRRRKRWEHGTERGYDLGCRCTPCWQARKRGRHLRARGVMPGEKVDAKPVRDHLNALYRSGWRVEEVTSETGVSGSSQWRITRRKVERVWARTADAVLALEPRRPMVMLDAAPLAEVFDRRGIVPHKMHDTDARALYKARARGTIREDTADRLLIRYCRLTLDEVYGYDYDSRAAS